MAPFSTSRSIKPATCVKLGECIRMIVPDIPLLHLLHYTISLKTMFFCSLTNPGMLVHPTGDFFVWALIGLFKSAYPNHRVDLVHRLDREPVVLFC